MKDENYGFIKTAVACPKLAVANVEYNISEIEKMIKDADKNNSALIVFPELCITGYTCQDLFNQKALIDKSKEGLEKLLKNTSQTQIIAALGMPVELDGRLYNAAVIIQSGKILGFVPKKHIPNYREFYEKRWFSSGSMVNDQIKKISFLNDTVPFGNLIFREKKNKFSFGVEICEDVWAAIPPSSYLSLSGANIILNLSASNEVVAKEEYRRQLVLQQSARCICGYLYASSGVYESTTDVVFSGHCMIAENGVSLKESERFSRNSIITYAYIIRRS
jgi:NAD+ synthase (glutamine-hydrolysing)